MPLRSLAIPALLGLSPIALPLLLACALRPEAATPKSAAPVVLPADEPPPVQTDMVALFVQDCHAVVPIGEHHGDDQPNDDRCEQSSLDQHCVPDRSGCWGERRMCKRACSGPCLGCRDTCSTGCDGCKSACPGGDASCIRSCAEARATCYTSCLVAKTTCEDRTCVAAEQACEAEYDARLLRECGPKCAQRVSCGRARMFEEGLEGGLARCAREFPVTAGFCEEACTAASW